MDFCTAWERSDFIFLLLSEIQKNWGDSGLINGNLLSEVQKNLGAYFLKARVVADLKIDKKKYS